jgi:hypothetical protein
VRPGDTVVVPLNLTKGNTIRLIIDIAQIVGNLELRLPQLIRHSFALSSQPWKIILLTIKLGHGFLGARDFAFEANRDTDRLDATRTAQEF